MKPERNIKTFLKALPKMTVLWLCLIGALLGLGFIGFVSYTILKPSMDKILVPLGFALVLAIFLIFLGSYKVHTGEWTQTPSSAGLRIALRDFFVATPLILGLIGTLYFIAISRYQNVPLLIISSIILWLLFRYLMRRVVSSK